MLRRVENLTGHEDDLLRFVMRVAGWKRLSAAMMLLAMSCAAALAGTITGTVTNKTTDRPAVGDTVTLLSLSAGLQELSHTKTDAQGHFSLTTPDDSQPYLVRVHHETGDYFQNMPPGMHTADITVYDVAAKVEGVSTEADVLRVEAANGQLTVTESYFVKNLSSPPKTQAGDHTYEIVLPTDATIDGAATVGPANMPLAATPDPVSPKGHYAFSYPIRPNEGDNGTRFQVTYHLPYSGSFTFHPKLVEGADNLAVMLPKSMQFSGTGFQLVPDDVNAQTYLVRGIAPGQSMQFTVSGSGQLPRDTGDGGQAQGAGGGQADASAPPGGPNGPPGGGLGTPIATPDPLAKYKWWILGGLGLALVIAAAFLLRQQPATVVTASQGAKTGPVAGKTAKAGPSVVGAAESRPGLLLEALKEELFTIESERIAGTLTAEQYAEVKAGIEVVLKRALDRARPYSAKRS
jgi:hypothetical protein